MKLTPEGKKVWDRPVYPENWEYKNPPHGPTGIIAERAGIPFGWTVASEALGGFISSKKSPTLFEPNDDAEYCIDLAIALCNKLAEVKREGS